MNQVFSLKRYVWLIKRQWYENATIYKWGIVLMVLAPDLLFWVTNTWKIVYYPDSNLNVETAMIVRMLFLYVFGALFFANMSSRRKKMIFFSLPVSTLERIAVAFTFVMVLMPALFYGITIIFDLTSVQLFDRIHGTSLQKYLKFGFPFIPLFFNSTLCCIFALGSLMFGKKGPAITVLVIVAFLFLLKWLLIWLAYSVKIGGYWGFLDNIMYYLFPVCWVLMYLVMKKKEA